MRVNFVSGFERKSLNLTDGKPRVITIQLFKNYHSGKRYSDVYRKKITIKYMYQQTFTLINIKYASVMYRLCNDDKQ